MSGGRMPWWWIKVLQNQIYCRSQGLVQAALFWWGRETKYVDFHHERRQVHIGSSGKEINDQFRRRKSEEDLEGQFEEVTCQTTFVSTSLMHSLKIFIVKKLSKRSILSQNFIERIECQCQNLRTMLWSHFRKRKMKQEEADWPTDPVQHSCFALLSPHYEKWAKMARQQNQ